MLQSIFRTLWFLINFAFVFILYFFQRTSAIFALEMIAKVFYIFPQRFLFDSLNLLKDRFLIFNFLIILIIWLEKINYTVDFWNHAKYLVLAEGERPNLFI